MKGAKKIKDYFDDVKPVTDEEIEELLDDLSNKGKGFKPGKITKHAKKRFRKEKDKYRHID